MKIMIWYENSPFGEAQKYEHIAYPNGIHGALKELFEKEEGNEVRAFTMQDEEQGLRQEDLNWADVLVYWSHGRWPEIDDARVAFLRDRVLNGMGIVLLHSAHASKIFSALLGTRTQCLRWREGPLTGDEKKNVPGAQENAGEWQRVWQVNPAHPIARGLSKEFFVIPQDETYGEYFEIPQPEELVFITNSEGGEVFRSGCCWYRGRGRIFYLSSGHETFPIYYQKEVQQVLVNAVRWAANTAEKEGWPVWAREAPREK